MKKSRFKNIRNILLVLTMFISVGAIYGSMMMLIDPTGKLLQMDNLLPFFKKLPFSEILFNDYVFSGIMLLIVNGITNLIAFIFLLKNKRIGTILSMIFGITLILWISIQFIILPTNPLSISFFIIGIIELLFGYIGFVFKTQEEFVFNLNDYPNVNTNSKEIVIYFSRMGYVKKKAYEKANELGAQIIELKAKEKTEGTLGFWWCGRFGVKKMDMEVEDINIDFSKYTKVIICSPIWVFNLASPIRYFCKKEKNNIKNVEYILVHHTNGKYLNAVKEMDDLLNTKHISYTSISCKMGKYKIIKE